MDKRDIKNFTLKELEDEVAKIGEKPYRARQIFLWVYKKAVVDFNGISNIPKELIDKLTGDYYIGTLKPHEHLKSGDKTEKLLFKLSDGNYVETVLIPSRERKTVCLSTQVGCKFACSFCASGYDGFIRNLTPSEIINQLIYLQNNLGHKITNYVFMGMGEPLDNYDNVAKAVMIMNAPQALNIGARRITISTCGIIPGIERLKELGLQVNLSVSLHAVNDKLRSALMPVNKIYPLEKLIKACEGFVEKSGRRITLEYILIKNVNDSLKDAAGLAAVAKKLKAKVNLIPYSACQGADFKSPDRKSMDTFLGRLIAEGAEGTLRESKGKDIRAACGQLAGRK